MTNDVISKCNLEHDLANTDWLVEKIKSNPTYAQNLYAALCNNVFVQNNIWSILKKETWSCSWRYAGDIIANILNYGDYMDWYCSGSEGTVTDEIQEDLLKLGWLVIDGSAR